MPGLAQRGDAPAVDGVGTTPCPSRTASAVPGEEGDRLIDRRRYARGAVAVGRAGSSGGSPGQGLAPPGMTPCQEGLAAPFAAKARWYCSVVVPPQSSRSGQPAAKSGDGASSATGKRIRLGDGTAPFRYWRAGVRAGRRCCTAAPRSTMIPGSGAS